MRLHVVFQYIYDSNYNVQELFKIFSVVYRTWLPPLPKIIVRPEQAVLIHRQWFHMNRQC